MFILVSQILFSLAVCFILIYDITLAISVAKRRLKKKDENPAVYIICMSFCGVLNKVTHLMLIDGYVISYALSGNDGYEAYRQVIGKQLSLVSTWGYLTPVYYNWLMTIHRVIVVLFPMKGWIFEEMRILGYCITIKIVSFIDLLIPYYSTCFINFHAHPATWISSCAPDRHMLTWFQNKYTIYFPVTAMLVNFSLILYMRVKRGTSSEAHVKRDKAMIRQAASTAIYLSIYEIGSLYIRLLPGSFDGWSSDNKDVFYFVRILTICSLNFFVYFVITRATRLIWIDFYGFSKKSMIVTTATVTL